MVINDIVCILIRMDKKEKEVTTSYPNLRFYVDNFEEVRWVWFIVYIYMRTFSLGI